MIEGEQSISHQLYNDNGQAHPLLLNPSPPHCGTIMVIALKSPNLSPIREHSTATAYSANSPSRSNMPPRSGRIVVFAIFLFVLIVYSSFQFGDTEERITRLKAYGPHRQSGGNTNTGGDVKQGPSIEGSNTERTPGAGPIQDVRNATLGVSPPLHSPS